MYSVHASFPCVWVVSSSVVLATRQSMYVYFYKSNVIKMVSAKYVQSCSFYPLSVTNVLE